MYAVSVCDDSAAEATYVAIVSLTKSILTVSPEHWTKLDELLSYAILCCRVWLWTILHVDNCSRSVLLHCCRRHHHSTRFLNQTTPRRKKSVAYSSD